jgi:short-subunit dehydrogenase
MKNFILIGANSELATSFAEELKLNKFNIYGASRKVVPYLSEKNQIQLEDYIENYKDLLNFIKNIEEPYIVFFNGFLAENRPKYFPSYPEITQTIQSNFLVPMELTNIINSQMKVKKFIYISSMAAIKPRYKNYIYGLSKKNLEEFVKKSNNFIYLIVRYGQIKTRMSLGHNEPPFTLTKDKASKKLIKIVQKKGIVYPTKSLLFISIVMRILPIKLIERLEN